MLLQKCQPWCQKMLELASLLSPRFSGPGSPCSLDTSSATSCLLHSSSVFTLQGESTLSPSHLSSQPYAGPQIPRKLLASQLQLEISGASFASPAYRRILLGTTGTNPVLFCSSTAFDTMSIAWNLKSSLPTLSSLRVIKQLRHPALFGSCAKLGLNPRQLPAR